MGQLENNGAKRWASGSLQRVVRRVCPTCEEQRVPQYDVELKCAEAAVHEWMQIAKRLHSVMGLRKTELRRIAAENEYDHALKDYGAWRLEAPKAPNAPHEPPPTGDSRKPETL